MDAIINIQFPNAVWTVSMATVEDAIIARLSIYIQTPNQWTASIVIDCYWSTVSDWEHDMTFLNQITKRKDIIVESRMMRPRDASETEWQVWAVLCQILGIVER